MVSSPKPPKNTSSISQGEIRSPEKSRSLSKKMPECERIASEPETPSEPRVAYSPMIVDEQNASRHSSKLSTADTRGAVSSLNEISVCEGIASSSRVEPLPSGALELTRKTLQQSFLLEKPLGEGCDSPRFKKSMIPKHGTYCRI